MENWSSVDWNSVGNGLMFLVITVLALVGKWKGDEQKKSTPPARTSTTPIMEVAGALVDTGTLNKHTAAIEALNLTLVAGQQNNKHIADEFTTAIYEMKEEIHDLRQEVSKASLLLLSVRR
jgi:hypothetical protein